MVIDLNADVGEGIGSDTLLMPYLSSCNIACGIHAGNSELITQTVRLAIEHHVNIGAHPSFPDRNNFGRLEMELPSVELKKVIYDQIIEVQKISIAEGGLLHHVKPHGALYNMAVVRKDIAETILSVFAELQQSPVLYAPFGSVIANLATEQGISVKHEVFADRNYNDDLTLVSRNKKNALLINPNEIVTHVLRMILEQQVKTIDGNFIPIKADSVCIHGDNPNAINIAKTLNEQLKLHGVSIS